ncbi:MAG: ABC transporter substrate-binding protein [Actinobacteria bacterium]|nr:ABC transporter substrate-binding protein [Actinomycetota bacterium]
MKNKFVVLLIIINIFIFGCGKKTDENVIRLGFFPNVTHSPVIVGLKKAYVKGAKIKIIAGANNAGAVLVARKDSNIKNVYDLKNKIVAVPQLGNTQDISLRILLKKFNLEDEAKGGSVKVLQASSSDLPILFTQKQVDAALVPEPWGSQLIDKLKAKIIVDWDEMWKGGNYPTTVVVVRESFLNKRPDLVKKWLAAHIKSVNYIKGNPKESLKLMNAELKKLTGKSLPDKVMKGALMRSKADYNLNKAAVYEFADEFYRTGYLKSKPDINGLIDLSYLSQPRGL